MFALLLTLAASSIPCASASAAQGPYEPNDSILSPAGPLALGQTYAAALETPTDKDLYSFYVTSPQGSDVSLAVANLGGSASVADLDARIADSLGTSVGTGASYVSKGESRVATATLQPGKYLVEVTTGERYGDAYTLTPGGSAGAFGSYARIAARCATATASVKALTAGLGKAEGKLQRATSRVRRTRYSGRNARKVARAELVKAKAQVAAKKAALKSATASQQPWCGIPQ
jgi:hypothetical protein